ncbi:MAG TPA: hypothetical protein VII31_00435 [Caldimonas sp.]
MDLKDFIQTAVTQIVEGVVAAQAAAAAHRVAVNPAIELGGRGGPSPTSPAAAGSRVSNISFDVAVTGVESSSAQGSGKLQVVGAWSARAGEGTHATGEHPTRLQFSLPIAFPEARLRRSTANALDSEFLQSVDNGDSTWLPS